MERLTGFGDLPHQNWGCLAIVRARRGRGEGLDTTPQFCGLKHDYERLS